MSRPSTLLRCILPALLVSLCACTKNPSPLEATASAEQPAAATAYRLRPGDIIHITVWKEEGLDQEVTLLPDGTVDFPLIGSFTAAGLTTGEVQALVKQKLHDMIPTASVTVLVKEARGNSISVVGQVARPGEIIMNQQLTIMQALSQVGGLTTFADEHDIVILRKINGKEKSIPFDYSDIANGRALESNVTLEPGDVIVVPTTSLF